MKKNLVNDDKIFNIISSPVITEKATVGTQFSRFAFNVSVAANKNDVKQAVEKLFNVKVNTVSIINRKGKKVVFRGKHGRRPDIKRAIVKLDPGQTIDTSLEIKYDT